MKDILDNKSNPFSVPDGYFDSLQERIMDNVQIEKARGRIIRITPLRVLIAVAACFLLIFTGAALFTTHSNKQPVVAEQVVDNDFYQWLYLSDMTTLLAGLLDITVPENLANNDIEYSGEEEAIMRFFERDNVNLIAMLNHIDNETFFIP